MVMPQVNSGKDILIVGHGAMNCSIIAKFRGTPLDKFWDGMTDNCQVVSLYNIINIILRFIQTKSCLVSYISIEVNK